MYDDACVACEVEFVVLSERVRKAICNTLVSDARDRGGRGRVLATALPDFGLSAGARLEPGLDLLNVARIDTLEEFPTSIMFWRRSTETRARHRNPIFSSKTGISPATSICVDELHTINLGVMQRLMAEIIDVLVTADFSRSRCTTRETLMLHSCEVILAGAIRYYDERRRRGRPVATEVGQLTPHMLGLESGTMHLKAMETYGLFSFVLQLLEEHIGLAGEQGRHLLAAGKELERWFEISAAEPRVMSDAACTALFKCAVRHVCFARDGGVAMTPKHHFFLHLSARRFRA